MPGLQQLESTQLPQDAVEVGRVIGAWGIKGWFKIMPYSASPEALFSSKRWFLLPATHCKKSFDGVLKLPISEARGHSDAVIAGSHDIADRETAELLKGARVFVPRSGFPTPNENEFYWVDLIGLQVLNQHGVDFGKVAELMSTGPQTVLVLEKQFEGKVFQTLIPFVSQYVLSVDLQLKKIIVDWQLDY